MGALRRQARSQSERKRAEPRRLQQLEPTRYHTLTTTCDETAGLSDCGSPQRPETEQTVSQGARGDYIRAARAHLPRDRAGPVLGHRMVDDYLRVYDNALAD